MAVSPPSNIFASLTLNRLKSLFHRGRSTGLVILSFPKSGRTWHRVMLGYYLANLAGLPTNKSMNLKLACRTLGISKIRYSHNGSNFTRARHWKDPQVANPSEWKGRPVLLIVRNPRDVLVSAYHHTKFRFNIYDGDISTFIRAPETGIEKLLTALNRWYENKHLAKSFEVLSYEGMHRQPEEMLNKTLALLGITGEPEHLKSAVAFASFEKMKALEKTNFFRDGRLARKSNDERGAKVREGRIGGFAEHLSADDLAFIEQEIARIGDPFASAYEK